MDGKLKKTLELMRERLLDLTGRNPLLNTKFSDRSHSHIRVVDEVPKVLFNKLKNGYMVLKALPPIDQQLPDESTEIFKDTLLNFKTTDEDYLSALASVDYLDEKSEEQVLKIERGLIDKVRKHLKLPERVWCDKSLLDHAKQHNINPSYELPNTNEIHEDGRHDDNYVQTLLLPDLLERKLEKIISKSNLWEDELGVQVLFIAYGFLEWKESQNDKVRISPLLLQSCKLERVKHGYGFEYRVSTDDSSIDLNLSLKIKLENDFGLTLPDFICNESDDNVEQYFDEILNIKNDRIPHLRFSRQIAIGIFPSSKQVMYDDLKADDWLSNTHSLVDKFFSLNQITQNESLPNEPEVESDPFMENSPWVVSEADSSQYAVITRLMNGENLAVEGPPGTGKSQTIVNSIAAALADGKSVLFVAEKKAALEVVKNRLDTNGLGNFCLPILSGDSKSAFYEKIKKRIEMEAPPQPRRFDSDFSQLIELKEKFNNYIELLNLNINFGGMTLRDLMGKVIFNNEFYNNLPPQVRELKSNIPLNIEYSALENVKTLLVEYERLNNLLKPQDTIWKKINSGNINNFDIDDINSYLHNGLEISKKLLNNIKSASLINELSDIKKNDILKLLELAKIFNENYKEILVDLVEIKFEFIGKKFMKRLVSDTNFIINNQINLKDGNFQSTLDNTVSLFDLVNKYNIEDVSKGSYTKKSADYEEEFEALKNIKNYIIEINDIFKLNISNVKILKFILRLGYENKSDLNDLVLHNLKNKIDKKIVKEIKNDWDILISEGISLKSTFNFDELMGQKTISEDLEVFRNTGIFGFLSPKVWRAKKRYKLINNNKKLTFDNAVNDLNRIIKWKSDVENFNQSEYAKAVLGKFFEGMNTDFDLILQSLKLSEDIPAKSLYDIQEICSIIEKISSKDLNFYSNKMLSYLNHYDFDKVDEIDRKLNHLSDLILNMSEDKSNFFELVDKVISEDHDTCADLQNNLTAIQKLKNIISDSNDISFYNLGNYSRNLSSLLENLPKSLVVFQALEFLFSIEKSQRLNLINILKNNKMKNLTDLSESIKNSILDVDEEFTKISNLCEFESKSFDFEIEVIINIFTDLIETINIIPDVIELKNVVKKLNSLNLSSFTDLIINFDDVCDYDKVYETLFFMSKSRKLWKDLNIKDLPKDDMDALRSYFSEIDKRHIEDTKKALQKTLIEFSDTLPGIRNGKKSEWTEMSLIKNEIEKQKRHVHIRDFIRRANNSLKELMPCWMMSPMAVAQYLPKGEVLFDIVIIDEASQMTPENAIGTILRGRQAMIVGDTNQLPPTNFFKNSSTNPTDENDDIDSEESMLISESILNVANTVFYPQRRLRWHYRSRHSSLIAFSNQYIYDGNLDVFPCSNEEGSDDGVKLVEVDGFYSSGVNDIEAKAVVDKIIYEMKANPDNSIAVVTMNQKQQDLILDEFNLLSKKYPHCDSFVSGWLKKEGGLQKFIIKNLENIQGDERDTIIISTVYGPDIKTGNVFQRFGPINGPSGKRRLNVLFTRARKKIITITSLKPTHILAERDHNIGAWLLKKWLEYSKTLKLDYSYETNKEPDSDFERHVIKEIESLGCVAVPQVGVSGYFIDIGVKHPDYPYGYLLGVECDGATYHSQKSARDRDRLREEILRGLGWDIHRIWSRSWFENPRAEVEKLRKVILNKLNEYAKQKKIS